MWLLPANFPLDAPHHLQYRAPAAFIGTTASLASSGEAKVHSVAAYAVVTHRESEVRVRRQTAVERASGTIKRKSRRPRARRRSLMVLIRSAADAMLFLQL